MPPRKAPKKADKKPAAPAPAAAEKPAPPPVPAPASRAPRTPSEDTIPAWVPFLLISVPALHVLFAPYTKVEESFGLHAVHDVLRFGMHPSGWSLWDHRTFPGAVPRSFVPPIVLALATMPTAVATNIMAVTTTDIDVQMLLRLTLVCFWAFSMIQLSSTVRQRFGALTSALFVLLSVAQFHIPYYAGRTLPNFFALPCAVLAYSYALNNEYWRAVAFLTATATVIRLELALMAVPLALNLVFLKRLSLWKALSAGLAGGFGALAISAPIDYLLWSPTLPHPSLPDFTPLHGAWPELSAALYNIVDGKADNWGVMPRTYYVGALVKMLLGAFPLVLLACGWAAAQGLSRVPAVYENKHLSRSVNEIVRVFGPSIIVLVAVLSGIGHKEWRFIVYVVPILNILAAAGAAALWYLPDLRQRQLARMGLLGLLGVTVAFSVFSSWVSSLNYPGGGVWRVLETLSIPEGSHIHFHSYPLQTGASLFTFLHDEASSGMAFPPKIPPTWVYSKDEDPKLLDPRGAYDAGLDYVVTGDWDTFTQGKLWKEVAQVEAYDGIKRGGQYLLYPGMAKKIAVLQRVD